MLKKTVSALLNSLGYEIRRRSPQADPRTDAQGGYQLYPYLDDDGEFDYEKYRAIQESGNKNHLGDTWVLEGNIAFLSEYLARESTVPRFGICHGTRGGKEQQWFRERLDCEVIGTEISETASQFPHTVQWDFHDENPAWAGQTDFIYSNSFDHSYDPEACLNTWINTLRPGGVCILEHSNMHGPEGVTELDPFGAELVRMPYLIALWGKDRFFLREMLTAPEKKEGLSYLSFLVIERRN